MAGTPNGNLMSAAEAKARLLELGQQGSAAASLLGSPAVRAGALLVAGALLGRMVGRGHTIGTADSIRQIALRAGLTAAPLLVEQFIRGFSQQVAAHERAPCEPATGEPGNPATHGP